MRLKTRYIAGVTGAAGLLLGLGCASAAPLSARVEAPQGVASTVAAYCWFRHGVRHCRGAHRYAYRSGYREYNIPEAYPTGSSRWWEEMDRQGRGGRGRR